MSNYNVARYRDTDLLQKFSGCKLSDCEKIVEYGKSHNNMLALTAQELRDIAGITELQANKIVSAFELVKRFNYNKVVGVKIYDSMDVVNLLMEDYLYENREHVTELMLNVKGEVFAREEISIGELSATNIHPREVFAPAIKNGAASIIIAHNHPSGDPTPSQEDIVATKRLVEASKVLGIKLTDHIILGHRKFVSLKAEGYIQD